MSAFSDYLEAALLNHILRNTAYSKPSTIHIGLFTADPGESGATGEVSGGSYARAAVTNDNVNFPQCAVSGTPTKTNAGIISFPTATAAWGTVTHWAIYDHPTNSTNMLAHGALSASRSVASGDSPRLVAGAISLTISNSTGGGLTDFAKRKLLDHVFGGPAYTPSASLYTGVGTALSGDTMTEWADTGYSRQLTGFDAPSGGACVNSDAETYAASVIDAGPVTLTHFGIWDDSGSGNLLFAGPLGTPRSVVNTDTVTLLDSALTVTFQ